MLNSNELKGNVRLLAHSLSVALTELGTQHLLLLYLSVLFKKKCIVYFSRIS
jgi:hypothetical protein